MLDWHETLRRTGRAAHVARCPDCSTLTGQDCDGTTAEDIRVAAAVLGSALTITHGGLNRTLYDVAQQLQLAMDPDWVDPPSIEPLQLLQGWFRWYEGAGPLDAAPAQLRADTVAVLAAAAGTAGQKINGPQDL